MQNEYDFMVVYSACDKGNMIEELVSSLRSMGRFVKRDNIVVFYTPPSSEYNYKILNNYALIKKVNNVTPKFIYYETRPPARFGEIIGHLDEISSPNVFILDCDTIIKKNINELLDGDFDVAYRVATGWEKIDKQKWEGLFKEHHKTPISVPNKGFMAFKNNTHKKIMKEYMDYMNMDLPILSPYEYQKDQYALALAISGFKIKIWDKNIHAYKWLNEDNVDTYVLHGRPQNWFKKVERFLWKIKHQFMTLKINSYF
ncbi:MAG: hypothetical protein A3K77_06690 [Euryarchaeota archaeon RBG_13_31_8]|nr:MAG: hypothetical protein A3K77_06690 [Euryarchaeota archaeon RBG_13_31_8]